MSKRPLAALCALLAFMAALVAVPLATAEPAEAHDVYYWKTVRTCIVDPPINHCTTERVRLPAHHSHPPPTCPAGTTGTYPNCVRIERDTRTSEEAAEAEKKRQQEEAERKRKEAEKEGGGGSTTTTTAPPPPTTAPPPPTTTAPPRPPRCATGHHRHGNTCHSHSFTPPCGTGTWTPHAGHTSKQRPPCPTTPPTTTTTAPPPGCATDHHRHSVGGTCHGDHVPPCGVGTWDPGHGHARVDLSACAYSDASHTMGPITYCGNQSHTHKTRHFHYGGNGCHPTADVHPDPPDPTRYTGANACANWAQDLVAAINTNSSPLPDRPASCAGFDLSGVLKKWFKGYSETVLLGMLAAIEKLEDAPSAFDEATTALASEIERRWDESPESTKRFITNVAAGVGCTALAAVAVKSTLATAGIAAPAWVTWAIANGAGAACAAAINEAIIAATGSSDDSGTDDDDSDGDGAEPEPEADPKPTAAEIKQNDDELNEATRRYWDEEITLAEYQAAFRRWARWRCEEMGQTGWCNR